MSALYIPKPSSSAAAFVVQTPLNRIIVMSTSGCRVRLYTATHVAAHTADTTVKLMVWIDTQPQVGASLTATSNPISHAERSALPSQSRWPCCLSPDSGMNTHAANAATDVTTSGIQKSQWYERCARIGPASTMPRPLPNPRRPETSAIPPATRWDGNVSRMIPNASGKIAPPQPWIVRATIINGSEVTSAPISVPRAKPVSATTSIRFFPNMSPSRPPIGVTTDAASK